MTTPTINIFDSNFINHANSSTVGKSPRNFNYVKNRANFDGCTIFTDRCYNQVTHVKSNYKIAWQVESPVHSDKYFYPAIKKYWDEFDMIWTYDDELVKKHPSKCKRSNFGGTTVLDPKIYPKTKNVCIVHSGKNDTPNHKLRYDIIQQYGDAGIDVYGKVTGRPFDNIVDVYKDYRYAIVIENINSDNYFSEKLTDAIACGCIPIYNGCIKSVDTIFGGDIPTWTDINYISAYIREYTEKRYDDNIISTTRNMNIVKENFYTTEDWLYEQYLKKIG